MNNDNIFTIRKTTLQDMPRLMDIFAHARKFMAENGNPNQWKNIKPTKEQIEKDIENGNSYVLMHKGEIHGTFCFFVGIDPTYNIIYDGEWINDNEYAVIHRIASSGKIKGTGTFMMEWAFNEHPNIRIDTHEDNFIMQNMLKKLGYKKCGTILLEDGNPRLAFQKV